jgi:eukaryotic-like serine/threonine-protein kinase
MSESKSNLKSSLDELVVGQQIGDYIILRRLGAGGMAHVFLAEQTSLKRKVALKIMRADFVGDPNYVNRFMREAQSAASLSQANIVQVYEVGQAGPWHYIAQEYISGRNLRQHLTRHGALEPIMAFNVLRQVGLALQKAAEQGVIHRDIKPENIMIATNGEIKVADFGLARIQNGSGTSELTQIGIAMGTPLYMSPEQIEGREVDHRTDIYSLGVTAYHMLAGKPPFEGDTPLAVAMQHVNKIPEPLANHRPDLPAELCSLIDKMMAKKPEDRIQSATALLRELRKIKVDDHADWDSLAQKLAETSWNGQQALPTRHLEATRQLQSILKGHLPSYWKSARFWVPFLLTIAVSIGCGLALAYIQPVPEIVPVQSVANKKSTVREQYQTAFWSGNPDDYRAVLKFFPPANDADYETIQYHHYAMKNLGMILLQSKGEKELLEALKYFHTLSEVELHPPSQAAGWAGLACVYDEMQTAIQENSDVRIDHFSPQIREQLERLDSISPLNVPYFNLLDRFLQERVLILMDKYNSLFGTSTEPALANPN